MRPFMIIAHRGASRYAPENTLPAFRKALQMGAGGIEFDVHLTRDMQPVIIHDASLKRTTNGKGYVYDYPLSELQTLDAGAWFGPKFKKTRIPSLQHVLAKISLLKHPPLVNIELKNILFPYPGLEQKVLRLIHRYRLGDCCVISSFNLRSLSAVRKLDPKIKLAVLYPAGTETPWNAAERLRATAIHSPYSGTSPELIQKAHEKGFAVVPFTVDNRHAVKRLFDWKADGVITNDPQAALAAVEDTPAT